MPVCRIRPATLLLSATLALPVWAQRLEYPPTRREDVVETVHGVTIADPYRWLENSEAAGVQSWTEQQNALTRAQLDRFGSEREQLAKRLEALYAPADVSSPRIYKDHYFFTKREGEQNHAVVYLREGSMTAEAKPVLDPNGFSADGTVALDWWWPSPDGSLIAYGRSAGGDENSTLYLRDVHAVADSVLSIPHMRFGSVAWDADGQGFHYTRYPAPGSVPAGDENYFRHVYYHRFGTAVEDDPKVFGEGQPKEQWHDVSTSSDYRAVFLTASLDWARNDLYYKLADSDGFKPLAQGLDGSFSADVLGEQLIILTNYQAPRYRVLAAAINDPDPKNWREIVPQQAGVIRGMVIVDGKIVLRVLENARSKLLVYAPDGAKVFEYVPSDPATIDELSGRPDKSELYFTYETFLAPRSVVRLSLDPLRAEAVHELDVTKQLGLRKGEYIAEQVWFTSRDGTRVPMFVVQRKNLPRDGNNPTILYGYGGFDISEEPGFRAWIFPWLDRGGVFAVANLRGGGEFGKEWHLAGRLAKKQNTFDDMIAAAEKLIADKYTRAERLGIRGGSNGGLLMGALLTQRPDLFRAVHCAVPLLDMLRYHNFSIARLWIPEYGSAEDPAQFDWLRAYSPYHRVKEGTAYPAVLFTTADGDTRVDPMHARKMAAALQAATSSERPILLWVETKAGHGAGKPLRKIIESQVDYLVFFLWQLGVIGEPAS